MQKIITYFAYDNIIYSLGIVILILFTVVLVLIDIIKNWTGVKKILKQCLKELIMDKNHFNKTIEYDESKYNWDFDNEMKYENYLNYRKYLAIYTFYSYLVIFVQYNLKELPLWIEFAYLFFIPGFVWFTPITKDKSFVRAVFYMAIFVFPLMLIVLYINGPISILTAGALYAGLIIWIDSVYHVSNFEMPSRLKRIRAKKEDFSQSTFLIEYLKALKESEAKKLKYALTFYSVGCIGLLIKALQLKIGDVIEINPDIRTAVWAILVGCLASLGWGAGLYFPISNNRTKLIELMKEI